MNKTQMSDTKEGLQGVINGLLMSLAVLVAKPSQPEVTVLGRLPGTRVFHRLESNPDSETYPGLAIICFDGPLFFATANALRDKVRAVTLAVTPPIEKILIDMEGVGYIDLEGADMLGNVTKDIKSAGEDIHIARVKQAVMSMIERDGVDRTIGHDHIHDSVFEAVHRFTST